MKRKYVILFSVLWALLVLGMIGIVSVWATRPRNNADAEMLSIEDEHLSILFDAPSFSLTDQDGKPASGETLKGHPYVAVLFFTHCPGPCPMMTSKMAKLQKTVTDDNIRFVSFTLDPEHDTPAVMKEYAEQFGGDQTRWMLLTGEKKALYDVAAGYKLAAIPATETSPIVHATKFLLVDGAGKIRGIYESTDPKDNDRLASDAHELATLGR